MRKHHRRTVRATLGATAAGLGAALGLAVLPAEADAIVFGADLNRPPNNPFGCETAGIGEFPPGSRQLITTPSQFTSCTWTANGRVPDFAETLAVPTSGTVTQIQVRVGPVTGPMQVVVYSSLGVFDPNDRTKPPSTACCQVRALSQVFTPAPNQITTVPVNLPVVTEKVPPPGTNILRGDSLGLSVLTRGVPVPAHNTGNYVPLNGAPVGGIYGPALGPGEERLPPAALSGFQLLLRADVTPTGAGAGAGGAGAGGAGDAGNSGSASREELAQLAAANRCAAGAGQTAAEHGGAPSPAVASGAGQTAAETGGARAHAVTLSVGQLRINQKISQAAVRRANAIDRWLNGGIEGRDICGGALGVNAFDQSVTFGRGDAPEIPAADPRPVTTATAAGASGAGKVTLTAKQLRINQRVSQAAVRRANALEARFDGGLTGGDVKDGSISLADLAPGVSIQNAGTPAQQPAATTTDVPKPKGGGGGKVTLSAGQLRVNQKIAQAAVRRTNKLIARLEGGLTAEDFRPGTLTGADLAK